MKQCLFPRIRIRRFGLVASLLALALSSAMTPSAFADTLSANLLPSGNFSGVTLGIYTGSPSESTWVTSDPAHIAVQSQGAGRYIPSSHIHMEANGVENNYLFSPFVAVQPTAAYAIGASVFMQHIDTKELGFYVHEYNAAHVEISGQWKGAITQDGYRQVSFTYTPSSVLVQYASLEIYTLATSGARANVGAASWYMTSVAVPGSGLSQPASSPTSPEPVAPKPLPASPSLPVQKTIARILGAVTPITQTGTPASQQPAAVPKASKHHKSRLAVAPLNPTHPAGQELAATVGIWGGFAAIAIGLGLARLLPKKRKQLPDIAIG